MLSRRQFLADDRRPGKSSFLAYQGHISGKAWSRPALLDKRLYLKDDREVVCLDLS
jgi:hypothetical protein